MKQIIQPYRVIQNDCAAKDLCRVVLAPADGGEVFSFKAGQFVMVHTLDDDGRSAFMRPYSIASAPSESRKRIELGVKSQGRMSGVIYSAKIGDVFGIQGPYGMFTLAENEPRVVIFAGGVGITPFRAMIREHAAGPSAQKIILFFSGRTKEDLLFHEEFDALAKRVSSLTYIPVITRGCPSGWEGECRRLDREMIKKYVQDFSVGVYMMCGPKDFMDHVKQLLIDQGVDVQKKLRSERY